MALEACDGEVLLASTVLRKSDRTTHVDLARRTTKAVVPPRYRLASNLFTAAFHFRRRRRRKRAPFASAAPKPTKTFSQRRASCSSCTSTTTAATTFLATLPAAFSAASFISLQPTIDILPIIQRNAQAVALDFGPAFSILGATTAVRAHARL